MICPTLVHLRIGVWIIRDRAAEFIISAALSYWIVHHHERATKSLRDAYGSRLEMQHALVAYWGNIAPEWLHRKKVGAQRDIGGQGIPCTFVSILIP
jgi:hypothetical protein